MSNEVIYRSHEPNHLKEVFVRSSPIIQLNILQTELRDQVPRIISLLQERGKITLYHDTPILNSIEKSLIQDTITSYIDQPSRKNLGLTGDAKIHGKTTTQDMIVNSTTDTTSIPYEGALVVHGGTYIHKQLVVNSDVDVKNNSIINVKDPVNGKDAVTKDYVDTIFAQKNPLTMQRYTALSTTSSEWVTFVSTTIPEGGAYRTHVSAQFSSRNTISIRLMVETTEIKRVTIHPDPNDVQSWSELFESIQMPYNNSQVKLQFKSEFGNYESKLHSAFVEFTSWRNAINSIYTSFKVPVTTTSTVPVIYHAWTTPILDTGIWRIRIMFTYKASNTITVTCFLDEEIVMEMRDSVKPYEVKVHEVVQNMTVNLEGSRDLVLAFHSDLGYSTTIMECYIEFTKLSAS
jgi:hypothetical protein